MGAVNVNSAEIYILLMWGYLVMSQLPLELHRTYMLIDLNSE